MRTTPSLKKKAASLIALHAKSKISGGVKSLAGIFLLRQMATLGQCMFQALKASFTGFVRRKWREMTTRQSAYSIPSSLRLRPGSFLSQEGYRDSHHGTLMSWLGFSRDTTLSSLRPRRQWSSEATKSLSPLLKGPEKNIEGGLNRGNK